MQEVLLRGRRSGGLWGFSILATSDGIGIFISQVYGKIKCFDLLNKMIIFLRLSQAVLLPTTGNYSWEIAFSR